MEKNKLNSIKKLNYFNLYANIGLPFNKIEEKCSKENIPFTLVNNETAKIGPEDTAVLVVAKTAINKMRIEINQVYPPEIPKMELTNANKEKKGFFKRLFHGDQK